MSSVQILRYNYSPMVDQLLRALTAEFQEEGVTRFKLILNVCGQARKSKYTHHVNVKLVKNGRPPPRPPPSLPSLRYLVVCAKLQCVTARTGAGWAGLLYACRSNHAKDATAACLPLFIAVPPSVL